MINTVRGKAIYMADDKVTTNKNVVNVLRLNVRTAKPSYKKEGGAQIAQVNLTVYDEDLIMILKSELVIGDFVEIMMGDAIINGNYINGVVYDVVYLDHEEYVAPVHYRDVGNAPSGRVRETENHADEVED